MAEKIKKKLIFMAAAVITVIAVFSVFFGKKDYTSVFSQSEGFIVLIDPGHGLPDSGATGTAGTQEEALNLQISMRLKACLEDMGVSVTMTRQDHNAIGDTKDADMAARRKLISEGAHDITVSIHQNAYPQDSQVKGAQVFFAPGSEQGQKLAASIQAQLNGALEPEKPRVEHEGDYYIVKSGERPAVIVECGFISNPEEEELLNKSQYQVTLARAVARGVMEYLEAAHNSQPAQ